MKDTDDFCCERKLMQLAVSKNEWHTKENTGKSMKMHFTHCGIPKGTSWAKAT